MPRLKLYIEPGHLHIHNKAFRNSQRGGGIGSDATIGSVQPYFRVLHEG